MSSPETFSAQGLEKPNMDAQNHRNLYAVGTKVWIPCDAEVWQTAEIIKPYDGNKITVRKIKSREELVIKITSDEELPPLQNPDILLGENDLTSLSYLHEPAILYNLYCRFVQSHAIYTYCGIVLVAVNPYKDLDIYGVDTMMAYRGQTMGSLDPHVFAVAEQAFNKMEIENNNQSIIVSGESGAGKTVSAKYAMRYFATISGSETETQVEKKVLASSPIMEAIGNAKTTRNDNSSRFGKYIELHFNERYHIIGASMRTYLLEKSRVVHQAVDERNYHIFYQLCSAREAFPHLQLGDSEEYYYLSSQPSNSHDNENFSETLNALNTLGFSQEDQQTIWKLLASILHIGNIEISDRSFRGVGDGDSCYISLDDPSLEIVATLLAVNKDELHKWLCYRRIVSMKETYEKPMSVDEASRARDALAKHMYASLFQWLISIMNKTMCESTPSNTCPIIGVLDIYGFEMFELNSFEQFCINYANEKLQQQFNLHVFKLEQEEYGKEGIEWKFIDFYDNQPCIDLIESKLGILDLLDEECRMPQGSDASWVGKLYSKCTKWDRFSKPKFAGSAFIIKHFAGDVEYYTDGFLDKNKDTVIEDQVYVLRNGKNPVLRTIFLIDSVIDRKLSVQERNKFSSLSNLKSATIGATPKSRMLTPMRPICATVGSPSQSKQNKKTVGSQFRDSLNALMITLNDTTPHYIRCIKPNDDKLPFKFDHQRAVDQLRACGVLETIRISAAGFPSRWTYVDFFLRYRVLLKSKKINRDDPKLTCQRIVEEYIQTEDNYKYGNTKIFFRAGQVAYLERKRADRRKDCSICIQKTWRKYICRKKYLQIRRSALLIQCYGRGYLDRKLASHLRQTKAATKIQKVIRAWLCRKNYLRVQAATLVLQQYYRGYVARKFTHKLRQNNAAIRIQSMVRMWLCYRHYHDTLTKIIKVQCCIRRWFARRCLKALKKEARSVAHVTKLNKGLENKIYTMQQKITELNNQLSSTKSLEIELQETKQKLAEQKQITSELNVIKKHSQKLQAQLDALQTEYEAEKKTSAQTLESYMAKCTNAEQKLLEAQQTIEHLESTLVLLKNNNEKSLMDIEECWNKKFDAEVLKARKEIEAEKSLYQKLLSEKRSIEDKLETLERQVKASNDGLKRNGSDLSLSSYQENGFAENVNAQSTIHVEEVKNLQKSLRVVQMEKDMLSKRIENEKLIRDNSNDNDISRLKEYNHLLQQNLNSLREATETSGNNSFIVIDDLTRQLEVMQDELLKTKTDNTKLQERLGGMAESLRKIVDYETSSSSLTEDKEMNQAMDAQKTINRHLLEEFQMEKEKWKEEKEKISNQLVQLLKENEHQQELLIAEFDKNPQSDAILHSNMKKLTHDHLQLKQKHDELLQKYVALRSNILLNGKEDSTIINFDVSTDKENIANSTTISTEDGTIIAKKKNRSEYMGMFQCSVEDDPIVTRNLIIELRPETALKLLPGLPAFILFMCVRYHDFSKDEKRIVSFLTNIVKNLQKVMKKRTDVSSVILWLSNTMKLVHIFKQYSGEQAFSSDNTSKQNLQVLQNFDLADYRQVFSDHAVILYQKLVQKMQDIIRPLIVPSILEHDSLGIDIGRNMRRSVGSLPVNQSPTSPTTMTLETELNTMYTKLVSYEVDQEVIVQIYKQLYYFMCANALNNLLLRKDLSYWAKGMQIRFNLSHLEQWIRDKISCPQDVVNTLLPIVQASQLLQARKTDDDVNTICEMCDKMNANQIIKLLTSFKPTDDCEDRISMSFIRKVKDKLEERPECQDKEKLLMDTKYVYPITLPFHPSNIRLEDIEIPEVLNLNMLKKL